MKTFYTLILKNTIENQKLNVFTKVCVRYEMSVEMQNRLLN